MSPSDRPLAVDVSSHAAGVLVRLSGSATMDRCDELNAFLADAAAGKPPLLVVDLSDLDFICSLGLGGLVAAYLRAMKHQGRFALSAPRPPILEVLQVTKLDTLLRVHESTESALHGSV